MADANTTLPRSGEKYKLESSTACSSWVRSYVRCPVFCKRELSDCFKKCTNDRKNQAKIDLSNEKKKTLLRPEISQFHESTAQFYVYVNSPIIPNICSLDWLCRLRYRTTMIHVSSMPKIHGVMMTMMMTIISFLQHTAIHFQSALRLYMFAHEYDRMKTILEHDSPP